MELFGKKDIGTSPINNIGATSPISKNANEAEEIKINFNQEDSGVKAVQLDDFFEFLDSKTVQKIMDTPAESKSRIISDVAQIEYETDGARAILNSLG